MTLDLDVTYVLVLALFSIPLVLLNAVLFRPFLRLLAERHERMEGAVARAEVMLGRAEERAKTFDARIHEATIQGLETRNRLRREAADELAERLSRERTRFRERVDAAIKEIEASASAAMSSVGQEAQQLAEMTAAKLLGREI